MQIRFITITTVVITMMALVGCRDGGNFDYDGDGVIDTNDCEPENADVYPGAEEACDDAIDNDCDGDIDMDDDHCNDPDGDGYPNDVDCAPEDPDSHPGAFEDCDDGIDNDCDGQVDGDDPACAGDDDDTTGPEDADGDGYDESEDCNDSDPGVNPGETETTCNGVDDDCDSDTLDEPDGDGDGDTICDDCDDGDAALNLSDSDGDGINTCDSTPDCNDNNNTIFPGAAELCDGLDNDCDGTIPADEADSDGDSYLICENDCDDDAAAVNPGVAETTCNTIDDDCDPITLDDPDGDGDGASLCVDCDDADAAANLNDTDSDGVTTCGPDNIAGTADDDCNDNEATIFPGADESCDSVDTDCDGALGAEEIDDDGDGQTECAGDCDDTDSAAYFGAVEQPCDGIDNDCDGAQHEDDLDDDGDGYSECQGDCDDSTTAIAPYNGETTCNGVDDDCNPGTQDEPDNDGDGDTVCDDCNDADATLNLEDADSDGQTTCGGDCDDTDPLTYDGATEACDGIDNDCDGSPGQDEVDADNDGVMACADDCDEGDASVHPGADEGCDGIDTNCDGSPDADEVDSDGDGFMVCENDCDDFNELVNPGVIENPANCTDDDCDGNVDGSGICGTISLTMADAKLVGENAEDHAGFIIDGAGDINNDGYDDLVMSATWADNGGPNTGTVYVKYGPVSGTIDLSTADAIIQNGFGHLGESLCGAGDLDDDGYADILIGNPWDQDGGGPAAGAAYVFYGPVSGTTSVAAADAKLIGEEPDDYAGWSTASAGDVNGDGYDDILVGAYQNEAGGADAGAAYLLWGPVVGSHDLSTADAIFVGEEPGDEAGTTVAGAGDIDGDGYDDVLVGSRLNSEVFTNAGASYLVYGPVSGTVDLSSADAKFRGEDTDDMASTVASAGDVNGDGFGDIFIGAQGHNTAVPDAGAAYVVFGPVSGTIDLSTADVQLYGSAESAVAGFAVSSAGDVDDDGYSDLIVGAYLDDTAGSNAGITYLFFGPLSGTMDLSDADALLFGVSPDRSGRSLSSAGDTNGDGYDDLVIGADQNDEGGFCAGAAYLVLGGP